MNNMHEVISTFLDDEPFDRQELARALDDPAGRALLMDLIALRQVVQPPDSVPDLTMPRRRSGWQIGLAAAAVFVALAGGYALGERNASTTVTEAPTATRVVEAVPFNPAGGR